MVLFPKPSKEHFFAAEDEGGFFEEGEDSIAFNNAKTRLGDAQKTIALVPPDLIPKEGSVTKKVAKQVLARSVSIRESYIKNALPHPEFKEAVKGTGLLNGVLMLPTNNKEYKFKSADGKKIITITEDLKLGILIE